MQSLDNDYWWTLVRSIQVKKRAGTKPQALPSSSTGTARKTKPRKPRTKTKSNLNWRVSAKAPVSMFSSMKKWRF